MAGTTDQIKGKAKQAAGDLTGDEELRQEGKADELTGKVKEAAEDVKDAVSGALDSVKDKLKK
ncbi:CsbD family protein [Conexibacter sp. W3-3-2]|uniref:CsbD family protein n=1 Tax=Paraconexibacter algicola TaxID=2133960 RepID=A0A2T4UGF7_9ACTN|nr:MULTISPECIES: CsbD family protein [Solirubrobacterales]MTD44581.1 CsbD family protein [Conexibacter sp. W3-3-2]PTL58322.1 CsbD family protein [Paraconexibacter algicola]